MLLAVLEKRAGMHIGQYDVFVNVAGGVRIDEPAADLGMAASIASSLKDTPVEPRSVAVGEIGLGGELRAVSQMEKRISEAVKLGFTRVVVPSGGVRSSRLPREVEVCEVEMLDDALTALLGGG
jgi:DNA repair protein RadA/Sms